MLALFLLGLSAMAYLTVREASLYESRSAIRTLRRTRKTSIPDRENLSAWSRAWLQLRVHLRGREFREAVEPATPQGTTHYDIRLRREIDRLVGKEVYHGQKEQL
jgi:hypothetical protein